MKATALERAALAAIWYATKTGLDKAIELGKEFRKENLELYKRIKELRMEFATAHSSIQAILDAVVEEDVQTEIRINEQKSKECNESNI